MSIDLPISREIRRLSMSLQETLVLVALIIVGATFGLLQSLDRFAATTQKTIAVQEASKSMSDGRVSAFRYRLSPSRKYLDEFHRYE